ncbi:hypothetical protein TgHK011_002689 [Trichoderma gracile]|nr:hypothetical protein TgHK011_002689 [Trichoderma gracile]
MLLKRKVAPVDLYLPVTGTRCLQPPTISAVQAQRGARLLLDSSNTRNHQSICCLRSPLDCIQPSDTMHHAPHSRNTTAGASPSPILEPTAPKSLAVEELAMPPEDVSGASSRFQVPENASSGIEKPYGQLAMHGSALPAVRPRTWRWARYSLIQSRLTPGTDGSPRDVFQIGRGVAQHPGSKTIECGMTGIKTVALLGHASRAG